MRRALQRLLGSHGHEVTLFASGRELLASQPCQRFDCILLDLHMPELNGFEVLQTLAARQDHPPVIVVTGHNLPGSAQYSAKLGACGFLIKPVEEARLLDAIVRCTAERPPDGGRSLHGAGE